MKTGLKNSRPVQSVFLFSFPSGRNKYENKCQFFPPLLYLPFLSLFSIHLISFSSLGVLLRPLEVVKLKCT